MKTLALAGALLLDRVVGQPALHPVRAIGALLGGAHRIRASRTPAASLVEGAAALALVSGLASLAAGWLTPRPGGTSGRVASALRRRTGQRPDLLAIGCEAALLHPAMALEALTEAGEGVASALRSGELEQARKRLARDLVSRDTRSLDSSLMASAAIESMAENLCDSVVAPACAYLAAGLRGAWVYRVVNTADAMFGYRTAEFIWYGKPAARTDDLLNYLPARISALLIALVAQRIPLPPTRARPPGNEIPSRVRSQAHLAAGPNAGWPMAAAAIVLGVRLEKPGAYVLNADGAPPGPDDIGRAATLVRRAAWLGVSLALAAEAAGR